MSSIPPSGRNAIVSPQNAEGVLMRIKTTSDSLMDAYRLVQSVLRDIQGLHRPTDPGPNASPEARAGFQKALEKFNSDLARLNNHLAQAQARVQDLEKELSKLNNQELPAAQARDRDAINRQVEQEKQNTQRAVETTTKAVSDDGGDVRRITLRAEIRQREIKGVGQRSVLQFTPVLPQMETGKDQRENRTIRSPIPKGVLPIGEL